jgi:hemerythrin-like domain-containing protein
VEQQTLGAALEAEHREIDGGIEAYLAATGTAQDQSETLVRSLAGLRRHIYLEEEFLFPPLKRSGLKGPIFAMEREHGQLWNTMAGIDSSIERGDAPGTRTACTELLGLLDKHNAMEEKVIYAQADELLDETASSALGDFLGSGALPEDWSPRSARG